MEKVQPGHPSEQMQQREASHILAMNVELRQDRGGIETMGAIVAFEVPIDRTFQIDALVV